MCICFGPKVTIKQKTAHEIKRVKDKTLKLEYFSCKPTFDFSIATTLQWGKNQQYAACFTSDDVEKL